MSRREARSSAENGAGAARAPPARVACRNGQPQLAGCSGARDARVECGREAALVGDHEALVGLLRVGEAARDADDPRRHLHVLKVERQRASRARRRARRPG